MSWGNEASVGGGRCHHHGLSNVGVAWSHHLLLHGRHAALDVHDNGPRYLVVVVESLGKMVVAAVLIDLHTVADNPDVGTNVHEGDEQEDELDDGYFPSLSGVVNAASIHETSNGREENV